MGVERLCLCVHPDSWQRPPGTEPVERGSDCQWPGSGAVHLALCAPESFYVRYLHEEGTPSMHTSLFVNYTEIKVGGEPKVNLKKKAVLYTTEPYT